MPVAVPGPSQALQGAGMACSPLRRAADCYKDQQGPMANTLPLQEQGWLEVIKDDMLGAHEPTQSWRIIPRDIAQGQGG